MDQKKSFGQVSENETSHHQSLLFSRIHNLDSFKVRNQETQKLIGATTTRESVFGKTNFCGISFCRIIFGNLPILRKK